MRGPSALLNVGAKGERAKPLEFYAVVYAVGNAFAARYHCLPPQPLQSRICCVHQYAVHGRGGTMLRGLPLIAPGSLPIAAISPVRTSERRPKPRFYYNHVS